VGQQSESSKHNLLQKQGKGADGPKVSRSKTRGKPKRGDINSIWEHEVRPSAVRSSTLGAIKQVSKKTVKDLPVGLARFLPRCFGRSGSATDHSQDREQLVKGVEERDEEELFDRFYALEDPMDEEEAKEHDEMINHVKAKSKHRITELDRVMLFLAEQREGMAYYSGPRKADKDRVIEEDAKFGPYVTQAEYQLLADELKEQSGIRSMIFFDMFFGMLVVANGLILGLSTEGTIDPERMLWKIVEYCFFFAFLIEFCIRIGISCSKKQFPKMLRDPWAMIDFFCLSISGIDFVMDFAMASGAAGLALISVMRVVRLLRLIRLVRLFNLFQELWILVSGLFHSISVLFWSIMMILLFCYIFGVGLFEALREFVSEPLDEEAFYHWGSVPKCMLSMAQIATYDGNKLTREYTAELTHPLMMVAFVMFITIVSFAILNLIVGVLLTTTLSNTNRDDGYSVITKRLLSHEAILGLRAALKLYCTTHDNLVIGDKPMLTRIRANYLSTLEKKPNEVVDAGMGTIPSGTAMMTQSSMTGAETEEQEPDTGNTLDRMRGRSSRWTQSMLSWGSLNKGQELANEIDEFGQARLEELSNRTFKQLFNRADVKDSDINEVFDELRNVHGKDMPISVDDFTTSILWMKSKPHPLEMAEFMNTLRDMYRRMVRQAEMVSVATEQMEEATVRIQESLMEAQKVGGAGDTGAGAAAGAPAVAPGAIVQMGDGAATKNDELSGGAMSVQEAELLQQERFRTQERMCWDAFDGVFGIAVLLNVAALGMEASLQVSRTRDITNTTFDSISFTWFIIEVFFYVVYCVEAALRAVFSYQMKEMKDFRTWLGRFPRFMWALDFPGCVRVARHVPSMLKDPMFAFEMSVIAIATLDNFFLRFLDLSPNLMAIVRIVSLLRLLRVARLIHLVKPLRIIAAGFFVNTRLIFWTLILLLCLIYMVAIAMVDLIGRGSTDETIRKYWSHVGDAMVTLALMATYNNWAIRIEEVGSKHYFVYPLGVLFTMMAGLGILNLVTGVMVQAAFAIISNDSNDRAMLALSDLRVEFRHAVRRVAVSHAKKKEQAKHRIEEHIAALFERLKVAKAKQRAAGKSGAVALKSAKTLAASPSKDAAGMSSSMSSDETSMNGDEEGKSDATEVEEVSEGSSQFGNTKNICEVLGSMWISHTEVAIRYRVSSDKSLEPMRDPKLSMLSWIGGARHPAINFEHHGISGAKEIGSIMVFRDVPIGRPLTFRYGGNYSNLRVYPNGTELSEIISKIDHQGATASKVWTVLMVKGILSELDGPGGVSATEGNIDEMCEYIGYAELEDIIQDRALNSMMELTGLRPEHILLAFSELNITGEERLRTSDLIEGVVRLQRQLVGIDVARSKSVMRRMIQEMDELYRVARGCQKAFAKVVEAMDEVKLSSQNDKVIEHHDLLANSADVLASGPNRAPNAMLSTQPSCLSLNEEATHDGALGDVVGNGSGGDSPLRNTSSASFSGSPSRGRARARFQKAAGRVVRDNSRPDVVGPNASAAHITFDYMERVHNPEAHDGSPGGQSHHDQPEVKSMSVEDANDVLRMKIERVKTHLDSRMGKIGLSAEGRLRIMSHATRKLHARAAGVHEDTVKVSSSTPPTPQAAQTLMDGSEEITMEDDDDRFSIDSADPTWE